MHTARHSGQPRSPRRRGAAVVPIIVAMLLLGGVGAAMHDLLTSPMQEHPAAMPARAATYAAEAGIRLLAAEYNSLSAGSSKTDLFEDVGGKTFTLDDATDAAFTLDVFSYGYQVVSHDEDTNTIVAKAATQVPLTDIEDNGSAPIAFPAGSKISVQDEVGNDIAVDLAGAGTIGTDADGNQTVTFTYVPPGTGIPLDASAGLDFVNVAYDTSSAPSGTAAQVSGLPSGMSNLPPENGRIAVEGEDKTYTYREMVVEGDGSVTLKGLAAESGGFDINDFRNDTLILRKTYAFRSTGSAGAGDLAATKTLAWYDSPDSGSSGLDPVDRVTDPSKVIETTMDDLAAFDSADIYVHDTIPGRRTKVVDINSYTSSQGTHVAYAAIHSLAMDKGNKAWGHVLRLNKDQLFNWRWKQDTRLSYDVQCKVATGWKLPFAAFGLSVRLQETGTEDEYDFYGVSFMKYYASGPRPASIHGDYMPDGFKPPGEGTVTTYWPYRPEQESFTPLDIDENDKVLLVFWRRKDGVSQWLAYKRLSYSPANSSSVTGERGAFPKQWDGDGRIVGDNTTLVVRAEEQFINGTKVNRFKVYYGDAATRNDAIAARTPNSIAYDIIAGGGERGRAMYLPQWDLSRSHDFPVFPALTTDEWTTGVDHFSLLMDAPDYTVDGTLRQCRWDAINTTAIEADPDADIRLLSDGGTIRTQEFLTPNSPDWPADPDDWPGDRPEVGLHAYGRLIEEDRFNNAVTFDDLSLGFLLYDDTPQPLVD